MSKGYSGLFSGTKGSRAAFGSTDYMKPTCNTFKGSEINKNFTIDKSRQIVTMATKGNIQ